MKPIVSVNSIAQCIESMKEKDIKRVYRHSISDCKDSIANMRQPA